MAANHPQLGSALSNIAELNRVYLEHQRESLREAEAGSRGSEKSAKNPKKRDDREKKPKKRKDKKRKDDRKSKKRKRERDDTKSKRRKKSKSRSRKEREASSSSSSSSGSSGESSGGSDDDASDDDSDSRGASDSNAVETAKRILAEFPDVRTDLANILRSVDAGEAVSVAGVPDDNLRASLTALFRALGMRARETAKTGRLWSSRKGAEAVLARVAPAFEGVPLGERLETLETRGKDARDSTARAEEAKNVAPSVAPNDEAVVREAAVAKRADENDDARTTKPPVTNPTDEREPATHIEPAIGPSIGPSARPPPRVVLGPAMPPRAALGGGGSRRTAGVGPARDRARGGAGRRGGARRGGGARARGGARGGDAYTSWASTPATRAEPGSTPARLPRRR